MTVAPRNRILLGDALARLRALPSSSVDLCVTSPPYWMARNYGVEGQLGNEPTAQEWVNNLVAVMAEVGRVLKPTGVAWVNVADLFSKGPRFGAPRKAALLLPERLLIALADTGWRCRSKAVWVKTNGMPTSARDRLANKHESVFMLTKAADYYFDADAVRLPHTSRHRGPRRARKDPTRWAGPLAGTQAGLLKSRYGGIPGDELGKALSDVWHLPTAGFAGHHPAVFPKGLVALPVLATSPERTCTRCDKPWLRRRIIAGVVPPRSVDPLRTPIMKIDRGPLVPACDCRTTWRRALVLDPFMGSGTTALVAKSLGRDFLGVELNPRFAALARRRLREEVSA